MKSSEALFNLDINLRTIKGSVSSIESPGSVHLIQDTFELLLGRVPKLNVSDELLGSCGQFQGVLESKQTVDKINELKLSNDLLFDLILSAENMSIVLVELSHSGQTCQSP